MTSHFYSTKTSFIFLNWYRNFSTANGRLNLKIKKWFKKNNKEKNWINIILQQLNILLYSVHFLRLCLSPLCLFVIFIAEMLLYRVICACHLFIKNWKEQDKVNWVDYHFSKIIVMRMYMQQCRNVWLPYWKSCV